MSALLMGIVTLAGAAGATEIYRWTDAEGVVHFSDSAPEGADAEALVVRDTTPPDYDPGSDPYSILNQAERTAAALARVEQEREEREEKRREERERIVIYERQRSIRYTSVYAPLAYPVAAPGFRPVHQRPVLKRQWRALEETGLTGPRPYSINSSAHHSRVQSSQSLPLAGGRQQR
jgi:hypothetical protein